MLTPSIILNFYKRKDIQEAIVEAAKSREIAIKYGENGFGKRPDSLNYSSEVLDLAKNGATSFHSSEELWENPLSIDTGMSQSEVNKLRKGWDFIIDIDSDDWSISKITTWLVIRALKDFGVSSASVKFSGNRGFHIGLPFESFPREYKGVETKLLFPDAPRRISSMLINHISENYIEVKNNDILFGKGLEKTFKKRFEELSGVGTTSLKKRVCAKCKSVLAEEQKASLEFQCRKCGIVINENAEFMVCPKCKKIMDKISRKVSCKCGSRESVEVFNALSVMKIDTLLISPRHLFRVPYSLHEKSGLVSMPFNPEKVLLFEKRFANPGIVKLSKHKFIDRISAKEGEAIKLLEASMSEIESSEKIRKEFEPVGEAIPETLFPPAIKKILEGLKDGKKRALFVLSNFLQCVGWDYSSIESRIKEWNKKNPEPLKETLIIGQLRYRKGSKERILPPNYDKDYYRGMGIIPTDEELRYKNPVRYTLSMAKRGKGPNKRSQKKAL